MAKWRRDNDQRACHWNKHNKVLLVVIILCGAILCNGYETDLPNIPASELYALQDLYDSTNGDQWIWSNITGAGIPWNFTDARPCTSNDSFAWQGVLCSFEAPYEYFNVRDIVLLQHNLTGTIPASIDQLQHLTGLALPNNQLHGPIPSSIGNIPTVRTIVLSGNALSGSLPTSLAQLTDLEYLKASENALDGTIPEFLSQLTNLHRLDLASNYFSGTVPASLGELTKLVHLLLLDNQLHGTLPPELGNLVELFQLELGGNKLTGSIPQSYTQLVNAALFHIDDNFLTGSIPANVGDMRALVFLDLGSNCLSGSVPETLGALPSLGYVHVHDNYLTGTLSPALGNMPKIVQFYLSGNILTGSIPTTFANLRTLQDLQIHDNILTGPIEHIFNSTLQTALSSIQLQNNQLTGDIPTEAFSLPQLRSVVIGVNCFHGAFPVEICQSRGLRNLVLDGLHSATNCQHKIFPGVTSAYTTMHHIFGTIPPCYYELPNLISLHLSGNELTGTLPDNLNISRSLIDLSLSHNAFHGHIPASIQERPWYSLDLSHNYLNGELSQHFGSKLYDTPLFGTVTYASANSSLYLDNNRLSGPIPHLIKEIGTISVLNSNIFSCRADKSDLPSNDQERNKYSCGSTLFDTPYYVWMGLVGTVVAALLLARYCHQRLDQYVDSTAIAKQVKLWINIGYTIEFQLKLKTYNHVCDICQIVCRVSFLCAILAVTLLAPTYLTLSRFFGTHTFEYAWTVSLDFLSGPVAFAVLFIMLGFVICCVLNFYARNIKYNHRNWRAVLSAREQEEMEVSEERRHLRHATIWERITVYCPMVLLNFTVVIGANIAFVYIVLYESSALVTIAQLVLSMFKLFWNKVGSRLISRYTSAHISKLDAKFPRSEYFTLQLFIAIVNNIGIPCLVIMFTSPACIYNMFVTAEPADSHYTSLECAHDDETSCSAYTTIFHSNTFHPPFIYSYQCSSSFITYYAASFVNQCIFSAFGTPIIQFACAPLYRISRKDTYWRHILKRLVPKLLRPPKPNLQVEDIKMDLFRPFFDANQLLLSLLTNFAIMITFGVVFPPLAACMAVTIFSVFYFSRVKLGIFISAATTANSPGYVALVDKECQGVGLMPVLHRSIWQLVIVSFLFYTWFLFDTLGNTEGFEGSFWVFFVYPILPLIILPIHVWLHADAYVRVRHQARAEQDAVAESEGRKEDDVYIEMPPMTSDGPNEAINAMHKGVEV